MKNRIKLFGIILIITILMVTCDNNNGEIHSHSYSDWIIEVAATCTTKEIQIQICSCGDEKSREIGVPLGHDLGWFFIPGYEKNICKRNNCGFIDEIKFTLKINDTGPGGGKIFYIADGQDGRSFGFTFYQNVNDTTGIIAYYLEHAPIDQGSSLTWASLGYSSIDIANTKEDIGTGKMNTALILATDKNAPAAKVCNDYINNEINDWFLPSIYELYELYKQKGASGEFSLGHYWSSSQNDNDITNAIVEGFHGINVGGSSEKTEQFYVRAIRAF